MGRVLADVARASLLLGSLSAGCSGPPVDARAVWIDVRKQTDGTRTLHVYDRGAIEDLPLLLPAELPLLRAQLDPAGRGLLIRGNKRDATYVDLGDARHLPLRLTPPPNQMSDSVSFTEAGDALHWREADKLHVVPLTPGIQLDYSKVGPWLDPPQAELLGTGWTVAARNAPILFAGDQVSFQASQQAQGQLVAFRYLDPLRPEARVQEIGRADLKPLLSMTRVEECSEVSQCKSDWAVDPAGASITMDYGSQDPNCRFRRWVWRDGSEAKCLRLVGDLALDPASLELLAAVDEDVLVVHDNLRMHWWNVETNEVDSINILGLPPYAWRTADSGRAVIFVSLAGPVVRMDEDGAHLVTTTQSSCQPGPGSGGLEVSPKGDYAAWACRPVDDGGEFLESVILRASPTGVERFEGIPMVVLAVDDAGDLLLYSAETGGGEDPEGVSPELEPLSLWTLSGDSVLRRVDQLEPTPEPVLLLQGDQSTFIQAAPLR